MKLSPHFALEEFTVSQTAERLGIPNRPDTIEVANMKVLCHKVLEPVRSLLKQPIFITSGYRSAALNGKIGGSRTSAHVDGRAADFICPSFGTPHEVAEVIAASNIEYDQLIYEGSWIHISWADQNRNQILTAQFTDEGVVYHTGLV